MVSSRFDAFQLKITASSPGKSKNWGQSVKFGMLWERNEGNVLQKLKEIQKFSPISIKSSCVHLS